MKDGRKKRNRDKPSPKQDGSASVSEPAAAEPVAEGGEISMDAPAPVPDEKLLRLQADFDNFRKRTLREREETYRRANADIMTDILPVLDHLELALKAASETEANAAFADGVKLVFDQMLGVLAKYGLVPIVAEGCPFDPAEHEAVSHLPSADTPENHVVVQTRRGYKLGERVLRAAHVVVSAGPPEAAGDASVMAEATEAGEGRMTNGM